MGLEFSESNGIPYQIDLKGKSILDIGGGPVSLLLKTINGKIRAVIDPCEYPSWIKRRYDAAGIFYGQESGEDIPYTFENKLDEVWIYNVLQHVQDPKKIIDNAKRISKVIRLFEWIDHPTNEMHPHSLTRASLMEWLGTGTGANLTVAEVNESGCVGKALYGVVNYSS